MQQLCEIIEYTVGNILTTYLSFDHRSRFFHRFLFLVDVTFASLFCYDGLFA